MSAHPTLAEARAFMADRQIKIPTDVPGYVVFWQGESIAWSVQPRPSDFAPGCKMVDLQTGAQFELIGGDKIRGGLTWHQLSHES